MVNVCRRHWRLHKSYVISQRRLIIRADCYSYYTMSLSTTWQPNTNVWHLCFICILMLATTQCEHGKNIFARACVCVCMFLLCKALNEITAKSILTNGKWENYWASLIHTKSICRQKSIEQNNNQTFIIK